jgi:hypothetical protein
LFLQGLGFKELSTPTVGGHPMPIIRKRRLPKKTSIASRSSLVASFFERTMRGVLQSQVDEKMPWLSDVLGEQLDKLVSSSSSDSDD